MSHSRNDSVLMTHSTRKSYKDKYLALKKNVPSVTKEAQNLEEISDFLAIAEQERERQHALLMALAAECMDLVNVLDSKDGKFGYDYKDIRNPVDAQLNHLDSILIIRRCRDLVKHASTRIGVASYGMQELKDKLINLKTGAALLQRPLERARRGHLETYEIGYNPNDVEIGDVGVNHGKNIRLAGFEYLTDKSDSENEELDQSENDSESEDDTSNALTVARPRQKVSNKHDISIN